MIYIQTEDLERHRICRSRPEAIHVNMRGVSKDNYVTHCYRARLYFVAFRYFGKI